MRLTIFAAASAALSFLAAAPASAETDETRAAAPISIVIHGGAGALAPGRYTAEQEAAYLAKLSEALDAGYAVLEEGGDALDAVEAAIVLMEDSPFFNAGKGAVFTSQGRNELDASIMDGATLNAGAIAGVKKVKNPIKLARAVMEKSRHVMFAREGAEKFAKEQGLESVRPRYFYSDRAWRAYKQAKAAEKTARATGQKASLPEDYKYGTVGAVALDKDGDLAAGTSTGGMTYKRFGRVGDSPIIGAGTFADNRSCAVSSTGHGEYFMRLTIARDICAQVEYGDKSVEDAAEDVINGRLADLGGTGGVIVLGADGSYAMTFNTAGMFRGVKTQTGVKEVAIYGE
ncbi:MAG: isoaspartyl peptidase/L-asparaginase [Pseudomonadota bacterium]